MDDMDYEVQCEQRDYAKAQLEVLNAQLVFLNQIDKQAIRNRQYSMVSMFLLIAILIAVAY